MMASLNELLVLFSRDQRGVTLVEYGIAITLAVMIGAAAFGMLASEVGGALAAAGSRMPD